MAGSKSPFVVAVVAATVLLSQVSFTLADSSEIEEALMIARAFLSIDEDRDQAAALNKRSSTGRLSVGEIGFDRTSGNWVFLESPTVRLKVSITTKQVVSVLYENERPEEFPSVSSDGRSLSDPDVQAHLVRIEIQSARETAIRYVESHLGVEAFEGVSLVREGLVERGSFFVYRFVWREPVNEDGFALGMKLVEVTVNPTSGGVSTFRYLVTEAPRQTTITADQCRAIVEGRFGLLADFSIERMALGMLRERQGSTIPVWAVTYSSTGPGGVRTNGCYLNANSGEFLD